MTESTPRWLAPAKLNLFLHVTGRRADGYHELETAFQFIGIFDELEFKITEDGSIYRLGGPLGVASDDDLVVRAARALREAAGRPELGVVITLAKGIPLGAGMGGGSSDAATTLLALNFLWQTGLGMEALVRIGRRLGADVPVFVRGQNALARGIGDELEPVEWPKLTYAVIHPGISISTGDVFQAPELTRNSPSITIPGSPMPGLSGAILPGHNDLEPVVVARYPAVRDALGWLGRRGAARMTGSGACVFAGFEDRARAEEALEGLPDGWSGFVADSLTRSPVRDLLQQLGALPL